MRVSLGHVRGGQPGDHAPFARQLDQLLEAHDGGEQVAVDELDALGRAGRTGGVDEREHVLGRDLRDRCASTSKPGFEPSTSDSASVPSGASPSTTITCSRLGSSERASSTCGRYACSQMRMLRARVRDHVGRSGWGRRCCRSRMGSRRASSRRGRRCETRACWRSSSAIVSPRRRPSFASPPASASTRSRSAAHVIVNSSPLVRIATSSPRSAAVIRKASASVCALTALRSLVIESVTAPFICSPFAIPLLPRGRPLRVCGRTVGR